jgi:uncharacterized membrane protein YcgQ (UPF0703/DUF1980 family)
VVEVAGMDFVVADVPKNNSINSFKQIVFLSIITCCVADFGLD